MPPAAAIRTARLLLRPFVAADAGRVADLAGAFEIADTTISIPHPYPAELAVDWIAKHEQEPHRSHAVTLAVTELTSGLVGCVELRDIDSEHAQAELGFWIGKPFWALGYATEACAALLRFGYESLNLNRVYAHHMVRNPASGRVLLKLGMCNEGLLRQRVRKWGRFEDVMVYAAVREDYKPENRS
ncbi:MAG TPA: GNAT family N-acetyltransferase [Burkholderiales bacterium]|nr:GNAT family N-acetyltransferase [Burkholderiales bacterium]